eukprot:2667220-Amphidinium_carterae.1
MFGALHLYVQEADLEAKRDKSRRACPWPRSAGAHMRGLQAEVRSYIPPVAAEPCDEYACSCLHEPAALSAHAADMWQGTIDTTGSTDAHYIQPLNTEVQLWQQNVGVVCQRAEFHPSVVCVDQAPRRNWDLDSGCLAALQGAGVSFRPLFPCLEHKIFAACLRSKLD